MFSNGADDGFDISGEGISETDKIEQVLFQVTVSHLWKLTYCFFDENLMRRLRQLSCL